MTNTQPKRHLSRAGLEEYLRQTAPASLAVAGQPICHIIIDAGNRQMMLRALVGGASATDPGYEHVAVRVITDSGQRWHEVRIDYFDRPHEAYLVLSDICDLMQQSSIAFPRAVESVLRTFRELLTSSRCLSREQEIGLYGELLFLANCIEVMGPVEALDAWKGFAANEHDFVFENGTFEIKTTSTERRRHRIGSVEQLQPLNGVPLWLVSVQLTAASNTTGSTLTTLIDEIRITTADLTDAFDRLLAQAGWRERDRDTYTARWRLRSRPAVFRVNADFPVLDRAAIDAGCARPELILNASYTIDVTTLAPGTPPVPADSFVGGTDDVTIN